MTNPTAPRISVIIPVYNQVCLLSRCLATLQQQTERSLEIVVVDDASPEDPEAAVGEFPGVVFHRLSKNLGYAGANNEGLARAAGRYLLFLNSDTELPAGLLKQMADYLDAQPEIAGLHPLHRGLDGEVQRTCYRFPDLRNGVLWDSVVHHRNPRHPAILDYQMADWDHQSERWVEHAQTSCLLVRREIYDRIGGMDPALFLFYNDTDFCRRMADTGSRIRFVPQFEIRHHGNASVATVDCPHSQVYGDRYRYYCKWFGWRGALAIRLALWSRVGYEAVMEMAHGDLTSAGRKLRRGIQVSRAMVPAR